MHKKDNFYYKLDPDKTNYLYSAPDSHMDLPRFCFDASQGRGPDFGKVKKVKSCLAGHFKSSTSREINWIFHFEMWNVPDPRNDIFMTE